MQRSHEEAARQKRSRCVPDRAPRLLRASATEQVTVENLDICLTPSHRDVSLGPNRLVCSHIAGLIQTEGPLSLQSASCGASENTETLIPSRYRIRPRGRRPVTSDSSEGKQLIKDQPRMEAL